MTVVSRKWIRENVMEISAFGGQIDKEDVLRMSVPRGGFETDLNRRGIENAEIRDHQIRFSILIPGIGWGAAFTYPSEEERWKRTIREEGDEESGRYMALTPPRRRRSTGTKKPAPKKKSTTKKSVKKRRK